MIYGGYKSKTTEGKKVGWLAAWLAVGLAGWLAAGLAGGLGGWVAGAGWVGGWLAGWLPGWLLARLPGRPAGWLMAGWLGGWMAGLFFFETHWISHVLDTVFCPSVNLGPQQPASQPDSSQPVGI